MNCVTKVLIEKYFKSNNKTNNVDAIKSISNKVQEKLYRMPRQQLPEICRLWLYKSGTCKDCQEFSKIRDNSDKKN